MSEPDVQEVDEIETFYIWESSTPYLAIYKILVNYLSVDYAIDSAILLALIQDKNLPIERTLRLIPYIHSGYLDTILEKNNGD